MNVKSPPDAGFFMAVLMEYKTNMWINLPTKKIFFFVGYLGLVFSLIFLLAFDYLQIVYSYDQWRIISFLLISYLIGISWCQRLLFINVPAHILTLTAAVTSVILIFGTISSLLATYSIISFWSVITVLVMFLCALILCDLLVGFTHQFVDGLVCVFGIIFFILSCQFVAGYFAGLQAQTLSRSLFFSGIVNVRFLNQIQTLILPLLFFYSMRSASNRFRILEIIFICQLISLFVLGARGSLLGLFVCFLFGMFIGVIRREHVIKLAAFLAWSLCIYFVCFKLIPSYVFDLDVNYAIRTADSGRFYLWEIGLSMFRENWLFGQGGMSFSLDSPSSIYSHPHNFVIHVLAEWGASMFLVLLLLSSVFLWAIVRLRRFNYFDSSLSAVVLAIVAGLTHGFFSGVFVMPIPQIIMLTLISVFMSFYIEAFYPKNIRISYVLVGWKKMVFSSVVSAAFGFVVLYAIAWRFNSDGSYNSDLVGTPGPGYWVDGGLKPPL